MPRLPTILGFAIPVSYVKEFIHHREAFAYDKANPNSGFRYLDPPRRQNASQPEGLKVALSGSSKAAESSARSSSARGPEVKRLPLERPRSEGRQFDCVGREGPSVTAGGGPGSEPGARSGPRRVCRR